MRNRSLLWLKSETCVVYQFKKRILTFGIPGQKTQQVAKDMTQASIFQVGRLPSSYYVHDVCCQTTLHNKTFYRNITGLKCPLCLCRRVRFSSVRPSSVCIGLRRVCERAHLLTDRRGGETHSRVGPASLVSLLHLFPPASFSLPTFFLPSTKVVGLGKPRFFSFFVFWDSNL